MRTWWAEREDRAIVTLTPLLGRWPAGKSRYQPLR